MARCLGCGQLMPCPHKARYHGLTWQRLPPGCQPFQKRMPSFHVARSVQGPAALQPAPWTLLQNPLDMQHEGNVTCRRAGSILAWMPIFRTEGSRSIASDGAASRCTAAVGRNRKSMAHANAVSGRNPILTSTGSPSEKRGATLIWTGRQKKKRGLLRPGVEDRSVRMHCGCTPVGSPAPCHCSITCRSRLFRAVCRAWGASCVLPQSSNETSCAAGSSLQVKPRQDGTEESRTCAAGCGGGDYQRA